jgi:hypothetical protein
MTTATTANDNSKQKQKPNKSSTNNNIRHHADRALATTATTVVYCIPFFTFLRLFVSCHLSLPKYLIPWRQYLSGKTIWQ